MWTGFAVATLFVVFRCFVRIKTFRRLYFDDAFVLLAWGTSLGTVTMWQIIVRGMYVNHAVAAGEIWPPPADFIPISNRFLRTSVGAIWFFYSGLWCVKLSFLFFFRRLYTNVQRLKWHWWTVLFVLIGSWAACVGDIDYGCLLPDLTTIAMSCETAESIRFTRTTLIVNCFLDIFTDICGKAFWRVLAEES